MKIFTHKTIWLLFIIITLGLSANAQDSIIKRDGSELKVKITEISDTELKYQKTGLSVLFSLSLDNVLLVTFENGERMIFENNKNSLLNNKKLLSAGTRVPLQMNETISSDSKFGRKVNAGEIITMTVQADVTDIDGYVLIKQGTLLNATVTKSVNRKAAGTKGKIGFNVDFVKAYDGQSVPLSLKYDSEGENRTAVAVAAAVVVAAPLLLIKGKAAIIESGTVFHALVVGDKNIKTNSKIDVIEKNQSSIYNDVDLSSKNEISSIKADEFISENMKPGMYYNGNYCLIDKEISITDVMIKCLNETGRAYNKFTVNKSQLIFHETTHEWKITTELTNNEDHSLKSKSPGLYYNGAFCKILEVMPDDYVKIKYLNETGRAYYKKVVLRSELVEVK